MIVKMSKIVLLGMENQREALLNSLMEFGAVELEPVDAKDCEILVHKPDIQEKTAKTENDIAEVRTALESLNKYCPEKKGLFPVRREVAASEFGRLMADRKPIWNAVKTVKELEEHLVRLKTEENRLSNLYASLLPWKDYSLPLELTGTKSTAFLAGSLPVAVDLQHAENESQDKAACFEIEVIHKDKDQLFICVVYHKAMERDCLAFLKTIGFNKAAFTGLTGTAAENIEKLQAGLSDLSAERENTVRRIKEQVKVRRSIETLYDELGMGLNRTIAEGKALETKKAFMLKGWIPEKLSRDAKERLESKYTVSIDITEPADDEEFPVLLENKGIAEAGEPVCKMYSLPNSREIDPNAVMAPFFILFFGLRLSDGGYGVMMSLAAALVLRRFKLEGSTRKFMKLIFYCGIATIFWGILFGSWFGIEALAKYRIWLNPVEEPELLLSWSLLFGVIHMYAGFGLKAANLIRDRKYLDALFDVGFVYIFYTGFIFILLPYVPKMDKAAAAPLVNIGKYMFIIGAALNLLTQGRDRKNIIGKFIGGLSSLYSVVGFMSDVLSYSRLLALGLATGIIATIINQMSSMFDIPVIIKIVMSAAILLVGHGINFAINALGAYVHSCRLQYLEFFGKFFTGGGQPFRPLKADTKYIVLKQNAAD